MALRSISQKVVQVEKRQLEEQRTAPFSTFAIFAFWFTAAIGALLLATFSFYSVDFSKKLADESLRIDRTITASIRPNIAAQPRTLETQRKVANQERLINNMRNVIGRLRAEQASLNERIVTMENEQRALREEIKRTRTATATTTLEKKTQERPLVVKPQAKSISKSPERTEPRSRNEKTAETPPQALTPKPVETKTIVNRDSPKPETKANVITPQPKPNQKIASNTISIDKTPVGSIKRVKTLQFGIDLGVNPTRSRAKQLWSDLTKMKPAIANKLKTVYLETGNAEGETRLIAGPYSDAGDAIKVCVELRTIDTYCKTTIFPK